MRPARRRVVVTGLGAVSALGADAVTTWEGLVAGRSAIRRIDRFDPSALACQVAAMAPDPQPRPLPRGPEPKELSARLRRAIVAAAEAVGDAGLDLDRVDPHALGVAIASGELDFDAAELLPPALAATGPDGSLSYAAFDAAIRRAGRPRLAERTFRGFLGSQIARVIGAAGPQRVDSVACASGTHAVGEAAQMIAADEADVMLAGGTDARVQPPILARYCRLGALCVDSNDRPERASRPFDRTRAGFVMGEGAAVLVLEALGHARARGARIRAEVLGAGASSDAYRVTDPHPDGRGAALAIRAALEDAGLDPADLGYVNAHGTSTRANDLAEARALHRALGDHAARVPVSSFKSMIGHAIQASGALELLGTVRALEEGVLPPTAGTTELDPAIELDVILGRARPVQARTALKSSFGFGGQNACVVLGRWSEGWRS